MSDPVVRFMNGGPGCSSVSGAMTENGPFQLSANGTLVLRETSWNKISNLLFIDSPANVGYSYKQGMAVNSTYSTDDHNTAKNNLAAQIAFFERFPQYAANDFFIMGESYAGTYIPTFTVDLLQYNAAQASAASKINLRGLNIGNPCTDELIDHNAFFEMVSSHDLIDSVLADNIVKNCPETFRYIPGDTCCQFNYTAYPAQSPECVANLNQMYTLFANNNLYDIYATCAGGPNGFSPCVANVPLDHFMNLASFRKAVHAEASPNMWYDCTPNLDYTSNYASVFQQVWPTIFQLDPSLTVQIYSGDADACVPFFGTRKWTSLLGGSVTDAWKPWQYIGPDGIEQLAGYTVGYEKLRFTSLKGCGHMAPSFQPVQSYQMFVNYLTLGNKKYPDAPVLKKRGSRAKPLA